MKVFPMSIYSVPHHCYGCKSVYKKTKRSFPKRTFNFRET